MTHMIRRTLAALLAGFVALFAFAPASTAPAAARAITPMQASTTKAPDAVPGLHAPAAGRWTALEAHAVREGSVPVIVRMKVTTRPEHTLSRAARASQRRAVSTTRAALLGELERTPRNLKTANDMPLIAFSATVQDLRRLKTSARVAVVTKDREHELDVLRSGQPQAGLRSPRTGKHRGSEPGPAITSPNGTTNQLPRWWDVRRIGRDVAFSNGWRGTGQSVAILDTGVAKGHPWIYPRVVREACYSVVRHCPNHRSSMLGPGAAAPCTFSRECAHGTHVAHTAAGRFGVASAARILAVQVFSRHRNGRPTYFDSDLTWGLRYVYQARKHYRIAAVNMSLGGALLRRNYCDQGATTNQSYVIDWLRVLRSVGIASVVASGNDNSPVGMRFPACVSFATSVGNTTITRTGADAVYGNVAGGSNSNVTLNLLAPGTDICSAVPAWVNPKGFECDHWIGTSMAAPHVTGAMAVLRQRRPGSNVLQLEEALRLGGLGVVDSRNQVFRSRINVWHALGRI